MPHFTPPTEPGPAPVGGRDHPLWRHYGHFECGITVWRDPGGTYHQSQIPYQGGARYTTFNDGIKISDTGDDPSVSLANATEVYMGGSTYEVDSAIAAALTAAGYTVDP